MQIEFIEDGHQYFITEEGIRRRVPSVTEIIEPVKSTRWYNDEAAERGTLIHRATALLEGSGDGSGLAWDRLPKEVEGPARRWEKFLARSPWKTLKCEYPVGSARYGFGGTADRIGEWKGKLAVLDIKSGMIEPWHPIQTAAYRLGIEESLGLRIETRLVIYLADLNPWPVEHKGNGDLPLFLACLAVRNFRRASYGN